MLKGLVTKIADAKLSDLNYSLGKLKEGVLSESGEYLENLKTDMSLVSNLVKAETGKINENVFHGKLQLPRIKPNINLKWPEEKKEERNIKQPAFVPLRNENIESQCFLGEDLDDLESCTFFKDDEEHIDINDLSNSSSLSSSSGNIENIFLNAKETKIREMKERFDLLIGDCVPTAEKRAKELQKCLEREHPLREEERRGDLNKLDLESLQLLSEALQTRITQSNSDLVRLLNLKDSMEQKREESLSDVKDLMSII